MIWKKDVLRPTQPYFVLDFYNFRQEVYLQQGISHFYAFKADQPTPIRAVPDGCIDLCFTYSDGKMNAYASGTVLKYQVRDEVVPPGEMFGVRLMPGVQCALLAVPLRRMVETALPLAEILTDQGLLPLMEEQTDFYQRIRIFLQEYSKSWNREAAGSPKQELVWSVKHMVYKSDGTVRISRMEEETGYSARYINKVFIEEMGFSPKVFCKIFQFQRALEFLNYGAPDKMTDAAVALGYYDQPQFIRDFKTYCGVTPMQYLKMIGQRGYRNQIRDTDYTKKTD